jgi:hypothetical protein
VADTRRRGQQILVKLARRDANDRPEWIKVDLETYELDVWYEPPSGELTRTRLREPQTHSVRKAIARCDRCVVF